MSTFKVPILVERDALPALSLTETRTELLPLRALRSVAPRVTVTLHLFPSTAATVNELPLEPLVIGLVPALTSTASAAVSTPLPVSVT